MKYFFVSLSILVIWLATILIATIVKDKGATQLFLSVQGLTLALFYIGFYKK